MPRQSFVALTSVALTANPCYHGTFVSEVASINCQLANEGYSSQIDLNASFESLDPADQVWALTNLLREAVGEAVVGSTDSALNAIAQGSAASSPSTPSDPVGLANTSWGSNWASGTSMDAVAAVYDWIFDDGPGGDNVECTGANTSGCFGHRYNILGPMPYSPACAGVGYAANSDGSNTFTLLYESASGCTSPAAQWNSTEWGSLSSVVTTPTTMPVTSAAVSPTTSAPSVRSVPTPPPLPSWWIYGSSSMATYYDRLPRDLWSLDTHLMWAAAVEHIPFSPTG